MTTVSLLLIMISFLITISICTHLDYINPICLPIGKDLIKKRFVGRNAVVGGWNAGIVKIKTKEHQHLSPVLTQAQLPVIANEQCKKIYREFLGYEVELGYSDRFLCTGFTAGDKDNCHGDSGGPVMVPVKRGNGSFTFYQIGIVALDKSCAELNVPKLNTNIQFEQYAKWIEKKLKMKINY